MAQKKTIVNQRIKDYDKLHESLYQKMLQNSDFDSCHELSKMFDLFLTYGSNEFSRGLDKGQEIWR